MEKNYFRQALLHTSPSPPSLRAISGETADGPHASKVLCAPLAWQQWGWFNPATGNVNAIGKPDVLMSFQSESPFGKGFGTNAKIK